MNLFELFVKIGADTSQAEKGMKNTQKNSETLTNKIKVMSAQFETAQKNVDKLTQEFNESVKKTGATSKETQELAKKLDDAEKEAEQAKKALDGYNSELGETEVKAEKAGGGLSNFASKLGKGLKTAAKIGTAAVTAVGGGIAALGTYAAKVGGDFEAQMSKVSAISGATGDDLQALEDKAKQLGIDTKFSATEAGQAFEYMAMAGWKTEQMLDGVAGIMDLAAASGEDLASVSDIVTDAMTAFGLSAEESTHFADVLAKASSNANTNVGLMGETFKYVAPVAGAMGFSVEDTATAIGLMANAGIKGSQAGTALRAMLSRLAKPTDEVEAAMKKLDLSITNSDGSMRELDEIMSDLRKGFDGLTEAEQTQIAAQLAGQEAMSGLLAIVNTSETEFNKLADAVNNADGAAKDMADTMANNLQGKLTLLKSSAEGFGLALYDKIQVPLTEMASWAVESLNKLTTAFNEKGVDGVVEAAGNILSAAITTIVDKLPEFVELAVSLIESFVNGPFVELGLDLIISLVEGIATAIEQDDFIQSIVEVVVKIVEILTDADTLIRLSDAGSKIVLALTDAIIDAIPTLTDAIPDIVENMVKAFIKNAPKMLLVGPQLVLKLIVGIVKAAIGLHEASTEILNILLEGITNGFASVYNKGKEIVGQLWDGIKNAWEDVKNWFSNAWDNLFGGRKVEVEAEVNDDDPDGSHRGGLRYVPYDGYIAELHKGERVLTAEEASAYNEGRNISVVQNIYSSAKTAADLMREAKWEQDRAVFGLV